MREELIAWQRIDQDNYFPQVKGFNPIPFFEKYNKIYSSEFFFEKFKIIKELKSPYSDYKLFKITNQLNPSIKNL